MLLLMFCQHAERFCSLNPNKKKWLFNFVQNYYVTTHDEKWLSLIKKNKLMVNFKIFVRCIVPIIFSYNAIWKGIILFMKSNIRITGKNDSLNLLQEALYPIWHVYNEIWKGFLWKGSKITFWKGNHSGLQFSIYIFINVWKWLD